MNYVVVMETEERVRDYGMEVEQETYVYQLTADSYEGAIQAALVEWDGYNGSTHELVFASYTVIEGKIVTR